MADMSSVECGYCLEKGVSLVKPKVLPCGDIHCLLCISDSYERDKKVRCPKCCKDFDVQLETLQDPEEANSKCFCDVCPSKGLHEVPAVRCCVVCNKKYCQRHKNAHNEVHDHKMVSVVEFLKHLERLQSTICKQHPQGTLSMGCRVCEQILCIKCLDDKGCRPLGTAHSAASLDTLVGEVAAVLGDMKVKVQDKVDRLSTLSSKSDHVLFQFDKETEDMLDLLHRTRDEQIRVLRERYDLLEAEVVNKRGSKRAEVKSFKDAVVDADQLHLSSSLKRLTTAIDENHQVDVVKGYNQIQTKIGKLLKDGPSLLKTDDVITLTTNGSLFRDIELEIAVTDSIEIIEPSVDKLQPVLRTTSLKPKSIELLKSVSIGDDRCTTAFSYRDNIYIGLSSTLSIPLLFKGGTICLMQREDYVIAERRFLSLSGSIHSVSARDDTLYVLENNHTRWTVRSYNLDSPNTPGNQWNHPDSSVSINQLAAVGSQVVVPNRGQQQVTVYSSTGDQIKQIPCPFLEGGESTAICTFNVESVIISSCSTSTVFRLDITTGLVMWKYAGIAKPTGVTCYGEHKVLFADNQRRDRTEIHVLYTGSDKVEYLTKLVDTTKRPPSRIYDLDIAENTLIVPRYHEKSVLFYSINCSDK